MSINYRYKTETGVTENGTLKFFVKYLSLNSYKRNIISFLVHLGFHLSSFLYFFWTLITLDFVFLVTLVFDPETLFRYFDCLEIHLTKIFCLFLLCLVVIVLTFTSVMVFKMSVISLLFFDNSC